MSENRYQITGKDGSYCESINKEFLINLRKSDKNFKGKRIRHSIQTWSDIINCDTIYPPNCVDRYDFILFNRTLK